MSSQDAPNATSWDREWGDSTQNYITKHWYPIWGPGIEYHLVTKCNTELTNYLNGTVEWFCSGRERCLFSSMIDCVMSELPETWKANMAAGAVLLGLLPAMLAFMSSTMAEFAILSLHRPILSFLLGLGSPAHGPMRSFEFDDPLQVLAKHPRRLILKPLTKDQTWLRYGIFFAEYFVALVAVGNVLHGSIELGLRGVCSFSTQSDFLPVMWNLHGILVWIIGVFCVRKGIRHTRIEIVPKISHQVSPAARLWTKIKFQISKSLVHELRLCSEQPKMTLSYRKETKSFILLSWFTSLELLFHILFGTLVFSAMLFVSTGDALVLAIRYLGSTVACRIILMYELSGIRERTYIEEGDDPVSGKRSHTI